MKEFDYEFPIGHQITLEFNGRLSLPRQSPTDSTAVEELIATVQKTEVALQNRRATRRAATGGMSDGDKVKLQLYLDYQQYSQHVVELGVDLSTIVGLAQLETLTAEGSQFCA